MGKQQAQQFDAANMHETLYRMPDQIKEAIDIGENAPIFRQTSVSNRYAMFGLGGSAIGADLLRSYAAVTEGGSHLNITVHRSYEAPAWLDSDTNVVVSSYSGETEETLSAFEEARKRTMRMVAITTGGTLHKRCITYGVPVINIPPGYQPRCAIAYSFFPLLTVLGRYGAFDAKAVRANSRGVNEILREVEAVRDLYASKQAKNPALALAKAIQSTIPVVYSSSSRMDAVNLRWRGQIQENAKHLSFGNFLPEMNHNEINGWQHPKTLTNKFHVIMLRDVDDHARVKLRFDALKDIIKGAVEGITVVEGKGKSLLSRMFTSIYLADWTSYHLAILDKEDPSPVPVIQSLKARLAKARQ
jgi:glucose/mannose-6-phosphate isomerase